ncbi:MAG: UPF0147 family protein [Nanoarchaeota archaeon]|nr:UPF0147 family protein [Nanoarchaeota archaeon]
MDSEKNENIDSIVDVLNELIEDVTIPRNIKSKLSIIVTILTDKTDLFLRINKALNELDEISNDSNMQPYTRTQLWNVVSMLEAI